ncbi:hypothetical protein KRR40_38865 [Niabella defluvii]|nr:hypothetical protein KRR40_38865 [Niabella sp. I65]
MLIARTYPAVLGVNAPAGNNGKLETRGWEISLNWRDRAGALSYHIGVIFLPTKRCFPILGTENHWFR